MLICGKRLTFFVGICLLCTQISECCDRRKSDKEEKKVVEGTALGVAYTCCPIYLGDDIAVCTSRAEFFAPTGYGYSL